MTAKLVSQPGKICLGGVICKSDGTIKSYFDLLTRVSARSRRRSPFLSRAFPCDLSHTTTVRDIVCDAVVDLFDNGSLNLRPLIKIFTTGGITLLAAVEIGNAAPSFGVASSGVSQGLN